MRGLEIAIWLGMLLWLPLGALLVDFDRGFFNGLLLLTIPLFVSTRSMIDFYETPVGEFGVLSRAAALSGLVAIVAIWSGGPFVAVFLLGAVTFGITLFFQPIAAWLEPNKVEDGPGD